MIVVVVLMFVGLTGAWLIVMRDEVGDMFGFSEPDNVDPRSIPAQNTQVDQDFRVTGMARDWDSDYSLIFSTDDTATVHSALVDSNFTAPLVRFRNGLFLAVDNFNRVHFFNPASGNLEPGPVLGGATYPTEKPQVSPNNRFVGYKVHASRTVSLSVTNGETVATGTLGTEDFADVMVNDDGSAVAVSPIVRYEDGVSVPQRELQVMSLLFDDSSTVRLLTLPEGKTARGAFVSGTAQEPVVLVVYEPPSGGVASWSLFTVDGGGFREEPGAPLSPGDESWRAYTFVPEGWEHRGGELVSGHAHYHDVGVTTIGFPSSPSDSLGASTCEPTFPKKFTTEQLTLDRNVAAVFLLRGSDLYLGLINLDECTIPLVPLPFERSLLQWGGVELGQVTGFYVTDPGLLESAGYRP